MIFSADIHKELILSSIEERPRITLMGTIINGVEI